MSVLTRIKNNQITDSTIWANAKIIPGSIVGSLFNGNITTTADFTITGNLTVLGSSTYMTVASTNTYVNDPLIVLNNGFAGSNTYDEGLIFNRGSGDNKAFIWSETFSEFRLITTAEAGTTYGNITSQLGLANLSLGKFYAEGRAIVGSFTTLGAANVGDLNATGNVLVSTLGASYVTASTATFGNIAAVNFGNASAIFTGASINLSGNVLASAIIGASLNVSGNVAASTVLAQLVTADDATFGNVVAGFIGNTGTAFTGETINLSGNVLGGLAQFAAINSTPVGNASASTGAFTTLSAANNFYANASIATTIQGTGAVVVPNGGISVSGAANIAGAITTGGAAQFNNTVTVGGITTFTNPTNATSVSDGAVKIQGGASVSKDLYVGGNLYAANIVGITANVITVEDPLLFLKPSYTFPYNYDIGIYSSFQGAGLTTAGNVLQHTGVVRHQETNTWTFASNLAEPGGGHVVFDNNTVYDPIKAGNLELTVTTDSTSASTGALIVAGGAGIGGNIFHTGTRLETSASNYLFASTPTTVDAFKAATDLEIGATSGTLTINNPTLVGTQTTQALYNTVTDTLNFARAANITMGHTSGITTLQGAANIQAVTTSTNSASGALKVMGGVGVRGNINVASNQIIAVGADLTANVYSESAIAVTKSANTAARISIQNYSTGSLAGSEFIAIADDGSNVGRFMSVGITNSTALIPGAGLLLPDTGYAISTSYNGLLLGTSDATDTVITVGGYAGANAIARFSHGNANVSIPRSTITTSQTTGAFTVTGGVGFGSNLNVARGAVINNSQSSGVGTAFQVKGTGATTLLYTVPGIDVVSIGGSNTAPASGITAQFNGTGAIIIPTGATGERPGLNGNVDIDGMIRLNSSSNQLEYYAGGNWTVAGSAFTIIAAEAFTGNGVQVAFTLSASSTTAATIVAINGVVQIPVTAYSVSTTTLTFTEAPAAGDVIDVRRLTTTATVGQLASGYTVFDAATNWGNILTGISSSVARLSISNAGDIYLPNGSDILYDESAINISANNTPYVVATRSQASFVTAKYIISVKNAASAFQSMEAILVTDQAGNAYVSTYGIVNNGTMIGTLTANVIANSVNLWYTCTHPAGINANVKVQSTYII